jgi:thiol-disulfide isomerase/thioredoxin
MRLSPSLAVCFSAAGVAFAQCEVPVPVRQLLEKPEFRHKIVETPAEKETRAAAYRKAHEQHPNNWFLLRSELRSFDEPSEAREFARAQRAAHPDALVYEMLEAEALLGKDTPEAIRRLRALSAARPDQPRIHLQIASAHGFGTLRDKSVVQKEVDAYRKLCPDSIDPQYLDLVSQHGTPQQISTVAAELRGRLEKDTGDVQRGRWENLWALEFKAAPVPEHPAVRKRIGEDLARFESAPQRQEAVWMNFLRSGYGSTGDQSAVDRLGAEIVKTHPQSNEAKRVVMEKFRKDHPYPSTGDESQRTEWRRLQIAESREWLKQWPGDGSTLLSVFFSLAELPDTKPEQIANAVDEFLAAYKKNPEFTTSPPFEFGISDAYLKHNIRIAEVPRLVEEGYTAAVARERRFEDDRYDQGSRGSQDYLHLERARLLIACHALNKEPAKARAVLDGLKLAEPAKQKSAMLALQAKVAEAESRKADAAVLYRAAIDARTGPKRPGKDTLEEDLQRVWKELGGSAETLALLTDKPKATAATDSRWEKPKNPLPAFSLADMGGKTWRLASLEGKALLINIWATWCGPCVAEHPEFQKLYDKLKQRSDVTVLSFNVDDDLGKVAPYIAEHKYTFPVIPAREVVDAVVPVLAIPRNWLVTAKGKLEWEQIGFGPNTDWEAGMLAKLDEVIRAK